jgi:Flp pilus assembly protein TadG
MALVTPLLLMLAFGVVEYGYFFYVQHTLQGAARSGARAAVIPGATAASVDAAIDNAMGAAGFGTSDYTKSYTSPGVSAGTQITVTVQGTWSAIGIQALPDAMGGIGDGKQVSGVVVMMKE